MMSEKAIGLPPIAGALRPARVGSEHAPVLSAELRGIAVTDGPQHW
jgi:hypothetical protein